MTLSKERLQEIKSLLLQLDHDTADVTELYAHIEAQDQRIAGLEHENSLLQGRLKEVDILHPQIEKPQCIEVTPEMIEAGLKFYPFEDWKDEVNAFYLTGIYRSMAALDQKYGGVNCRDEPKTKCQE